MIRIRYSDDSIKEYKSLDVANFMVLNTLFSSGGRVAPIEAVEVMGVTTSGATVERMLKIKLGAIESDW